MTSAAGSFDNPARQALVPRLVPREDLLAEVWGHLDPNITTRTVDQAIFRLRQKIEPDPSRPIYIRTAHWDGYTLSVPGSKAERKAHARPDHKNG
jgi:DNA-binding winged helix-turn-helix (wHTH) protein